MDLETAAPWGMTPLGPATKRKVRDAASYHTSWPPLPINQNSLMTDHAADEVRQRVRIGKVQRIEAVGSKTSREKFRAIGVAGIGEIAIHVSHPVGAHGEVPPIWFSISAPPCVQVKALGGIHTTAAGTPTATVTS